MSRIRLESSTGKQYWVAPPAPAGPKPSGYAFAFPKSGSTLLDNLLREYCAETNYSYFSLFDNAFSQGVRTAEVREDALQCFRESGVIYGGFRHYPRFDLPLENARILLLVRDPRDMIVSLYYSLVQSHRIPRGNLALAQERKRTSAMRIDEFAIRRADGYLRAFNQYRRKLFCYDIRTYRYEDVIFRKTEWLSSMVDELDLPRDEEAISGVSARHDLLPSSEDESRHVRQVRPGNYLNKLTRDTIERMNDALGDFLAHYGYEI